MSVIRFQNSDQEPKVKILALQGQVDESNLSELSTALDPLVTQEGIETIIMDFSELDFLNSKVIGYLADLHSRLEQVKRRLVISGASSDVTDILELVGLTSLVSCYPDIDSALSDLD